jgi:hypothetical protein
VLGGETVREDEAEMMAEHYGEEAAMSLEVQEGGCGGARWLVCRGG